MICAVRPSVKAAAALLAAAVGSASAAEPMSLSEALTRAVANDPAVPESLASYDVDLAAAPQERGSLYPSIGASATAQENYNKTKSQFFGSFEEHYPSYGAGVELRQPLFRLDWFARLDRADALDATAKAALRQRTMQLGIRVADRYFGVLDARDALRLAIAEAKSVRESLEDTRKRYEVQLIPGTDLKEAQARDDLAQAQLLVARENLETAQDLLDETTLNGRAPLPALPLDVEFPPLEPADPEVWTARALEQGADVVLARQQVAVAKANVKSRKADAMPQLDAVASYNYNDSSQSRIGQERDAAVVGLQLTIPIYAGGVNTARVNEAEARLRVAEASLLRIESETEREARRLFREVRTAYAQSAAYRRALDSAIAARTAVANGYEAGTRTIADVLDARSAVTQAERNLNQTRYGLLQSLLKLKQTAGVLGEKDFVAVDALLRATDDANHQENTGMH